MSLSFQWGGVGPKWGLFIEFQFIITKLTEYHGKALNCGRVNFDIFNRQPLQYHPGSGGHSINQFCFVADGACPHLSYSIQSG